MNELKEKGLIGSKKEGRKMKYYITNKGLLKRAKTGVTSHPGSKNHADEIVEYNGTPITMTELGEIYALICKNEDVLYPKSRFKRSDMVAEFMSEVRKAGKVTDDIKKKYHLK